jgi:hypothetical protein
MMEAQKALLNLGFLALFWDYCELLFAYKLYNNFNLLRSI